MRKTELRVRSYEANTKELRGRARKHFSRRPIRLLTLFQNSLVFVLYLFSFCSIPLLSWAGNGTTTASFLELMPNGRAAGMGGAYTALANDASAMAWNPAGLTRVKSFSVHAMYQMYVQGTSYQYLAGAFDLPGLGPIGVHAAMLGSGDIPKTTEDSSGGLIESGTSFTTSDLNLGVGWATKLFFGMRVGVVGTWFQQRIDTGTTSGFAADFGWQWTPFPMLRLGAAYAHLGPKVNGESLPTTWRAGAAISLDPLMVAGEVTQAVGAPMIFHVGAEYELLGMLALRGGYQTGLGAGGLSGFQGGLGMKWSFLALDYALAPMGDLGLSHRVSLGLNF
jgi:hypothetical protein